MAQCVSHVTRVFRENPKFGAREVVLREVADLVEELGAALVVEEFAGQSLFLLAQSRNDLRAEVIALGREIMKPLGPRGAVDKMGVVELLDHSWFPLFPVALNVSSESESHKLPACIWRE